ncbi:hypothetical protein ACO2RV_11900 [Ancylobacter sp. VNQ12]|uniref:hypothetical protein n=1 Tax=Ancylobacter sp. VNQ12 TaxID=3400920 RepID=UPI003C0D9747
MKALVRAAGGASLYFLGAASGFALAIPLAAVALGANTGARMTPPVVSLYGPPALPIQSHMINRTAKGSRLDIRTPVAPDSSTMVAKSEPATPDGSLAERVTAETITPSISRPIRITPADPVPTRPARATPKGCLSSIGATRANLATDELTVCIADAAMIRDLE